MSCDTKQKNNDITSVDMPQKAGIDTVAVKNDYNPESKLYIWKTTEDYTKFKNPSFKKDILNADSLIKGLNELNENIFLIKLKISNDTIYTTIRDSKYLSESIGITGAEIYLADVVLNLTELPGIKYIDIFMEEGSHFQSGTWSRDNFKKYKTIK